MTAVGIDVGKANLDLAVDGHSGATRFPNTQVGISKVIKRLLALGASRIVVEATGGHGIGPGTQAGHPHPRRAVP